MFQKFNILVQHESIKKESLCVPDQNNFYFTLNASKDYSAIFKEHVIKYNECYYIIIVYVIFFKQTFVENWYGIDITKYKKKNNQSLK